MSLWSGPYAVAALVLLAAGLAKAWDPVMTAGALRGAGLAVPAAAVRVGGAVEAGLAGAASVSSAVVPAALVAVSYAAFAAFVVVVLRRHLPLGTCGCFGRADTPPRALHVAVDLAAAVAAGGAAVAASGGGRLGLVEAVHHQPAGGGPFIALAVVGAAAAILSLTVRPRVPASAGQRAPRPAGPAVKGSDS